MINMHPIKQWCSVSNNGMKTCAERAMLWTTGFTKSGVDTFLLSNIAYLWKQEKKNDKICKLKALFLCLKNKKKNHAGRKPDDEIDHQGQPLDWNCNSILTRHDCSSSKALSPGFCLLWIFPCLGLSLSVMQCASSGRGSGLSVHLVSHTHHHTHHPSATPPTPTVTCTACQQLSPSYFGGCVMQGHKGQGVSGPGEGGGGLHPPLCMGPVCTAQNGWSVRQDWREAYQPGLPLFLLSSRRPPLLWYIGTEGEKAGRTRRRTVVSMWPHAATLGLTMNWCKFRYIPPIPAPRPATLCPAHPRCAGWPPGGHGASPGLCLII